MAYRVVAPINVNGLTESWTLRAAGPLPIIMNSRKSSIAE